MEEPRGEPVLVAIVGGKASGKTTLVEALLRALTRRGIRVAAVKHTHERAPEVDRPGSDSWRMSRAGASTVVLASPGITAAFRGEGGDLEDALYVARCLDPRARVILLEGFKSRVIPREDVTKVVIGGDERVEEMLRLARGEVWRVESARRGEAGGVSFDPDEVEALAQRIVGLVGESGGGEPER